jgi:hypothetical protein
MNETDFPICPKHDSFMIEYNFEPWEAVLPQGTLEPFDVLIWAAQLCTSQARLRVFTRWSHEAR